MLQSFTMTSVSSYVRNDSYTCFVYGKLSGHEMMQRIVSIVHYKKQKAILAKQKAGDDIGMCEIS